MTKKERRERKAAAMRLAAATIAQAPPLVTDKSRLETCRRKQRYETVWAAEMVARKTKASAYQCPVCWKYHTTSKSPALRKKGATTP